MQPNKGGATVRRRVTTDPDAAAAERILARVQRGEEELFPHELVQRMQRENPIRVMREYRRLTQRELAVAVGTDPSHLSDVERGRATGNVELLTRLAEVLRVHPTIISPRVDT